MSLQPTLPFLRMPATPRFPTSLTLLSFVLSLTLLSPHFHPQAQAATPVPDSDPFAAGVRTSDPLPSTDQIKQFILPPGFEAQLVAQEPDVHKPMNMAFDDQGRLWVTTSREYPFAAPLNQPGRDRIMIFQNFGPDGRAQKITTFASGLNIPIGIYPIPAGSFRTFPAPSTPGERLKGDACIVWSIPNIWWIEDTDGDGTADRKELFFGPFDHTRDTHGNQASFRRGFDGWLYATHGFNNHSKVSGRDGSSVDMNSGNTYRMQLSGIRIEHHTHGQVNPFGLAWDPDGNLYSSDCHSAPTYQLLAGGFYPSFGKPHDGLGFAPVLMEHSHGSTAIDGMLFYSDNLWPQEFHGNIFIGNVMTSRLNRDKLEFHGSSPQAIELPDFVRSNDSWFRPVDNLLAPDGALYIADFYNRIIGHYEVPLQHPGRDRERGRIWRIIYRNPDGKPALRPAALPTSLNRLITELASPSLPRRMMAMNSIQDRFGSDAIPPLQSAVTQSLSSSPSASASTLVHSLWLLHRLNALTPTTLNAASQHSNRTVRVHTQRILAESISTSTSTTSPTTSPTTPPTLSLALQGIQDPDALVRRCAAEALGKSPHLTHLQALLLALSQCPPQDTHLNYVLRKAIRDQLKNDSLMTQAQSASWSESHLQTLLSIAVAVPSPQAATFLLQHLNAAPPSTPLEDILRHAARFAPEKDLPNLAQAAQSKLQKNLGAQLDLFNSIHQGLQQRGIAMPQSLQSWGTSIVQPILTDSSANNQGWYSLPLESNPTPNPWNFEDRSCSDGTKSKLLSSLPGGESLTGILRSADFIAPNQISFYLCGHDGPPPAPPLRRNKVRLILNSNQSVIHEVHPPRNDVAQRIQWNLSSVQGQSVHLEVIDQDTGSAYAWLAIGRLSPETVPWPTIAPKSAADQWIAAANIAAQLRISPLTDVFAQRANSDAQDPQIRIAAARSWISLNPTQSIPSLATTLNSPTISQSFKPLLGDLLAEQNVNTARQAVLQAIKSAPQRWQARWTLNLAAHPAGAEALLAAAEQGSIPARLLNSVPVKNRIMAAAPTNWEKRHQQLVASLPPGDESREKSVQEHRNTFSQGRPEDGARIFQNTCALCHKLNGQGGLVGPQLDGIGARGIERLCEDILDPNRNVDHAFQTTLISLKDGDSLSGLFRREEGELLILANAAGQEVSVPKKDIASRKETSTSLMPDNFGEALSTTDFNHLLTFLLQQKPSR